MTDDPVQLVREHARRLWERRWSIVLAAWVLSLAGWAAVALLPNVYTAKAQIHVDTESMIGPLMRNLTVLPDVAGQFQVMRQTILSRPNLADVIAEAGPDTAVAGAVDYEDLLTELARDIEIRALNAALLEIRYHAHDRETAYRVVRAVVDLFVERNLGLTQRDVDAAQAFIGRQISEYEAKLRDADLALARFKRDHAEELHGSDRAQSELDDARSSKRVLESERASASWQREQLALQLASAPRRLSAAEALSGPTRTELRLNELQSELDRLLLVFTERHPRVSGMQRLVQQAEEDVARERSGRRGSATIANPIVAQLEEEQRRLDLRIMDLDRRLDLVADDIDRLSLTVAETPEVEADLTRLTRDYDALSYNYKELVQRRETAHLAKQMDTETSSVEFRIVEPPVLPLLPSGPPRPLLMLAVSVAALAASAGIAWLRILLRRGVVHPRQLERHFDLPVLGVVREVVAPGQRSLRAAEHALAVLVLALYLAASGGVIQFYRMNPLDPTPATFADQSRRWVEQKLAAVTASLPGLPTAAAAGATR